MTSLFKKRYYSDDLTESEKKQNDKDWLMVFGDISMNQSEIDEVIINISKEFKNKENKQI
jgi:hypothetical protein